VFGLSIWEIFLILVIALLVVGPERLPGLARTIGGWVSKVKRFVAKAKEELDSEFNLQDMHNLLNSQESEIAKLRALVEETRQEVTDSGRQVLGAVDEAQASFRDAAQSEHAATSASEEATAHGTGESATSPDHPAPPAEAAKPLSFEDEIRVLEESSGQAFKRPFEPLPEPVPEPIAPTSGATESNSQNPKST
jgi:sec-independent protein translocase protein TatB